MNEKTRRAMEPLVSALCEGTIDEQQLRELEALLREDVECRRFYLQYVDLHSKLTVHPGLAVGVQVPESPNEQDDLAVLDLANTSLERFEKHGKRRPRSLGWLAASLLLLTVIAVGSWQLFVFATDDPRSPKLARSKGDVFLVTGEGSVSVPAKHRLRRGDRLKLGENASAVLSYDDGTKVYLHSESVVQRPSKHEKADLQLVSGAMEVDAAKQSEDRPLVFVTDHARYVVLGTRFRLYRESEASRLELDEGEVRVESQAHNEETNVFAGHVAIATSRPNEMEVRPMALGRAELRTAIPRGGGAVTFSRQGDSLTAYRAQNGLRIWGVDDGELRAECQLPRSITNGLAYFSDTDTVVRVADLGKPGIVQCWDTKESEARSRKISSMNARTRTLSPDGQFVAESGDGGTTVYRVSIEPWKLKRAYHLQGTGKAWSLALSPKAEFLAASYWDGTVRVYRLQFEDHAEEPPIEPEFELRLNGTPTRLALSSDGRLLAVFTKKDGLLLIDLSTGARHALWDGNATSLTSLKFTSDDQGLIAGLHDETARMWATSDGQPLLVVDVGHIPRDIAWAENESLLATAGRELKIWECELP